MGGLLHFGTARGAQSPPLIAVPNVTAQPSTASVPITVLLYNGPLLCGFNVAITIYFMTYFCRLSLNTVSGVR